MISFTESQTETLDFIVILDSGIAALLDCTDSDIFVINYVVFILRGN